MVEIAVLWVADDVISYESLAHVRQYHVDYSASPGEMPEL